MNFATIETLNKRKHADVLILPYWNEKKTAVQATGSVAMDQHVRGPIEAGDFSGKEGELAILYIAGQPEKRVILLGLGAQEKITVEKLRRSFACLTKACRLKKIKELNILVPRISSLTEEDIIRGIAEGLLLTNYAFDGLKDELTKKDPTVLLSKATLIGAGKKAPAALKKYIGIAEGVYLARDLVNGNADDVTPQYIGHCAKELASKLPHVKTTVFDKKRLQKEKMGLLLAVSRGSSHDPALIIVEYKGNPKSKDHTVIVGKGVTFDTGGLNLKPTGSMEAMKCDMGGAATVLGTIVAIATNQMKVNVTAVIPTAENAIGKNSYKPGDVYTSYTGKTVEIGNTDAEGRLILADALAYAAKHLKPTRIIDFATLTGAMEITLGAETTGIMSNHDALANSLMHAGDDTYERLCRLPLYEEYKEQLKSDIADIKNIGGRQAGSITAALFLQEFVGETPWVHCDIAGTAYLSEARRYNPKHGTGVGVRLMISFLENL